MEHREHDQLAKNISILIFPDELALLQRAADKKVQFLQTYIRVEAVKAARRDTKKSRRTRK